MSIVRALASYAPAVVLPRVVGLLLALILTRMMSRPDYGLFVLVMTVGETVDSIFCNWIRISLARFTSHKPDAMGQETRRSLSLHAIALLPAALVAACVSPLIQRDDALTFFLAVLMYIFSLGLMRMPATVMSVQNDRNGVLMLESGRAVGMLLLGVSATLVSSFYFWPAIGCAISGILAGTFGAFRCLRKVEMNGGTQGSLRLFLGYGLPIIPSALIAGILASSDRFILNLFNGSEAVALYAAGIMLARQPLDFIFSLAGTRAFSMLMSDYETGGRTLAAERLKELISGMAFITIPAAAGVSLVCRPLSDLLLAQEYRDAATALIPIAALTALIIGFKTFVLDQVFHMERRNTLAAIIQLPAALFGVIMLYILIPKGETVGCSIAVLLQYSLLFSMSYFFAYRMIPFSLPWLDLGKIGIATILMTVAVLSSIPALGSISTLFSLMAEVLIGVVVYAVASLLLRPSPVREFDKR